jgi:uncharacterized membrane protein YedE/YeeE
MASPQRSRPVRAGYDRLGLGNPATVLALLEVAGGWDPRLLFVMGGAVRVAAIGFRP